MPHGKICYLEIPAKTAEDVIADCRKQIEAAGGRVLMGLYEEPRR